MSSSARTYRAHVSYRGTHLHGVAPQPGLRTVAGVLTDALVAVTGQRPVALAFAARTDRGVHARMQLASFRLDHAPDAMSLRAALPSDVHLVSITEVPRAYHARNSALRKTYRYRIIQGAVTPNAWCVVPPLNVTRMRTLADALTGTRDWTALRHPRCSARNPVRTVDAITVRTRALQHGARLVIIDVNGDGFLRQMVRIIAGTLAMVGAGWLTVEGVMDAAESRNRAGTGPAAPACGLTLRRIHDVI